MTERQKITIPPAFAAEVLAERGESGQAWIDALPEKFAAICTAWDLVVDGEPRHGHLGLVVPVLQDERKCVLKMTWADETTHQEILALQLWRGNGAVQVFDAKPDEGVLLLERLDPARTLENVHIETAIDVSGKLLRRLAIPAPTDFSRLAEHAEAMSTLMAERWHQLREPFPKSILDTAQSMSLRLAASSENVLVDYDLHYGNVLAGTREPWLAIDPKVIAGDVEYGLWPLMLCRPEAEDYAGLTRRLTALVAAADADDDKARDWTLVRAVDYWLWALSIGLTEDPKRCKGIVEWLLRT